METMKIALINMPFCYLESPSLALSQLKSVLEEDRLIAERVEINTFYFQHDFAQFFGLDIHRRISDSETKLLGEWLFSHIIHKKSPLEIKTFIDEYCPDIENEMNHVLENIELFIDSLVEQYSLTEFEIVGCTTLYQQTVASLALAKRLNDLDRDQIIVMGGGNCEGEMGKALIRNFHFLDFVFSGCALNSFPNFVSNILDSRMEDCHKIDGVFSKNNRCAVNWDTAAVASKVPENACIEELAEVESFDKEYIVGLHGKERAVNDVVHVEYTDFLKSFDDKVNSMVGDMKPRLVLETSRGCWWGEMKHCTFCGSCGWDISYKQMSPENAINYINRVIDKHEEHTGFFECVDQLIPKDFPSKVAPFLHLGEKNGLFYEVRATMSEEDLSSLANSGIRAIQPGIEALSTSLLKTMSKGTSSGQNIIHLKHCVSFGIVPMWALLIGLPGELDDYYPAYKRTLPNLLHLPPPMTVSPVGFHRNSPYTWYPEKFGLKLTPSKVYSHIYSLPDEEINSLAYFFEDTTENPVYRSNVESHIEDLNWMVEQWRNRWLEKDAELPQLYFKEKGNTSFAYDSRSGIPIEHELTDIELNILKAFSKKMSTVKTVRKNIPIEDSKFIAILKGLIGKGLLFYDDGRCLNLVLEKETLIPSFLKNLRKGALALH